MVLECNVAGMVYTVEEGEGPAEWGRVPDRGEDNCRWAESREVREVSWRPAGGRLATHITVGAQLMVRWRLVTRHVRGSPQCGEGWRCA